MAPIWDTRRSCAVSSTSSTKSGVKPPAGDGMRGRSATTEEEEEELATADEGVGAAAAESTGEGRVRFPPAAPPASLAALDDADAVVPPTITGEEDRAASIGGGVLSGTGSKRRRRAVVGDGMRGVGGMGVHGRHARICIVGCLQYTTPPSPRLGRYSAPYNNDPLNSPRLSRSSASRCPRCPLSTARLASGPTAPSENTRMSLLLPAWCLYAKRCSTCSQQQSL